MDALHIEVKNGDFNGALTEALGHLLEKKFVDAILIPQETPHGNSVVQTLVRKKSALKKTAPINFVMPVNSARILVTLSESEPDQKVAVVLRPCELRAAVELVKLNQINRENFLFVAIDCPGTLKMSVYDGKAGELKKSGKDPSQELLRTGSEFLRDACKACEYFWPLKGTADVVVTHFGSDLTREMFLTGDTQKGLDALKVLAQTGLAEVKLPQTRKAAVEKAHAANAEYRKKWFEECKKKLGSIDGLLATLSNCIRCYNCRDACPICYCKECIFDSDYMKASPRSLLRKAGKRGLVRMPQDTLLFHVTRLNHMVTSCVRCGMCTEACPNDIPVGLLFGAEADTVQKIFDYIAGKDPKEPLPLATFKEKELEQTGGAH